jgi:hypothetical protein
MVKVAEAARAARKVWTGSQPDWLASLGVIKPTPAAQAVAASRLLAGIVDVGSAPVVLPALGFSGQQCAELLAEYLGLDLDVVRFIADHPRWEANARLLSGPSGSPEAAEGFARWLRHIRESGDVLVMGDVVKVRPDFADVDVEGLADIAAHHVMETCAMDYDEEGPLAGVVLTVDKGVALVAWADDIDGASDNDDGSDGCMTMTVWRMAAGVLVRP